MKFKRLYLLRNFCLISFTVWAGYTHSQILEHFTQKKLTGKTLYKRVDVKIQINNKQQQSLGSIEIAHGEDDKFKILYAELIDRNGKVVRKLKKNDFVTKNRRSRGTFYQDELITEFKILSYNYPYIITYGYETKVKDYLFLSHWYAPLNHGMAPINSSLEVTVPSDLKLNISQSKPTSFSERKNKNSTKTLKWNYFTFKVPHQEIFSSSNREIYPHVLIAPQQFHFGVDGNLANWAGFGDWFLELNKNKLALTQSEKQIIDSITKGIEIKESIIKTLYEYLQKNTTYVNVSVDLGGFQSYPASYVCENKYGDCKALTTYMKAMLLYKNIPSNYVIIWAGTNDVIKPKQLVPQFNHVILGVPLNNDTLWLENTSSVTPYNYVGTFTQNRPALWVTPSKSSIVSLPTPSVDDVLEKTEYHFDINTNGEGKLDIYYKLHGQAFERLATISKFSEKRDLENRFLPKVNQINVDINNWEIAEFKDEQSYIEITSNATVNNLITKVGDGLFMTPPVCEVPSFEEPQKRKSEVRLTTPIHSVTNSQYKIQQFEGYYIQLPKPVSIKNEFGTYEYQVIIENDLLKVIESFTLKNNEYALQEYPNFYQFIHEVKSAQKKLLIFFKTK